MIDELFQPYLKEGEKLEIKEAVMARNGQSLYLGVQTDAALDEEALSTVRREILAQLPELTDVEFDVHVVGKKAADREILNRVLSRLMEERKTDPWLRALSEEGHHLEGDTLVFAVLGERAAGVLNENLAAKLSASIREEFGVSAGVRFQNDANTYEQTLEDVDKTLEEKDQPGDYGNGNGNGSGAGGKDRFADGRLRGRIISDKPIAIRDMPRDEVMVTVAGEVFSLETRQVKKSEKAKQFDKTGSDTSTLVTFCFTDKTDSTCAKMFVENKDWEAMEGVLEKGTGVIVRGKIEYDQYLKSPVVRARDVNLWEVPKREDTMAEKRVELHAHTKLSAFDGVTEPKDLVKRAIKWGHPAIAITDHGVVHGLPAAYDAGKGKIKVILGMEGYLIEDKEDGEGNIDYRSGRYYHIVLLAKNAVGLKNLYKLVSLTHMNYVFNQRPRIPRKVLEEYREGLIVGSACQAGELYQAIIFGAEEERLLDIASFYDYLEVQPLSNNSFMIQDTRYPTTSFEDIKGYNLKVLDLGKRLGIPVVATGDTHYMDPEDNVVRQIIQAGIGYSDVDRDEGLYFKTTDEMMEEMNYFPEEDRYDMVIRNPQAIADMCEDIPPAPGSEFPRPTIENADQILRESCEENLKARYGDPAPADLVERLNKELDSIISNKYSVLYVSAKMLVEKSNSDGFVVGSRGSVGSSFAAFMSGISEVNPLAAHYICPKCKHFEWGDREKYECGVDMPPKNCPECGTLMEQDGYTIPFETFLGFTGNKEPDIDLNFAGVYQATAQKYVDEIFGAKNTFKAGTIGTVADKTAFGFINAYCEATHKTVGRFERERLAKLCENVKRTTGQHPGGIIIVPEGHEIYEVCPIQYPANKKETGIITTHFEYHSFEKALFKLDILGHDGPTLVRLLNNSTGIDPQTVPIADEKVLSIFQSPEALDIKDPNYRFKDGTYGVPEFGTVTARGMLNDSKPSTIGELVRLSGLGHGTGVWDGNALDLIRNGTATMNEVIATRDDIMTYLIGKGLPAPDAFDIMEKVRKGLVAAHKVDKWPEWVDEMKEHGVPDWYIGSCEKIEYMFPRGHAAAYVIMSCRIAYYKVYYPEHFYAARFTTKVDDFNWEVISRGKDLVWARMEEIDRYIEDAPRGKTVTKEKNEKTVLEIVYEMMCRGYEFTAPSFDHSAADIFRVEDGKVVVPLNALDGIGTNAATAIMDAYEELPFETIEDIQTRGGANKTAIEALRKAGLLDGMDESNQLSFF